MVRKVLEPGPASATAAASAVAVQLNAAWAIKSENNKTTQNSILLPYNSRM